MREAVLSTDVPAAEAETKLDHSEKVTPAPSLVQKMAKRSACHFSKFLFHGLDSATACRLARIQRILIHYTSIDPLGDFTAASIEILDDRIKRESLNLVVNALVARAFGAPLKSIFRSLGGKDAVPAYQVNAVREPSSHCICGEVAGSEVTIGDEEFLLERGVILDSMADTLLEDGQAGFYILIAVGDAILARCLITPPRIGDGRDLVTKFQQQRIPVQVLSFGASREAHECALELGLSGEQVLEIETALHLDALLERPEPFLLLTSDHECAEYVSKNGMVGYFSERQRFDSDESILSFRSLDLRAVWQVFTNARRLQRQRQWRIAAALLAGSIVLGVVALFFL